MLTNLVQVKPGLARAVKWTGGPEKCQHSTGKRKLDQEAVFMIIFLTFLSFRKLAITCQVYMLFPVSDIDNFCNLSKLWKDS